MLGGGRGEGFPSSGGGRSAAVGGLIGCGGEDRQREKEISTAGGKGRGMGGGGGGGGDCLMGVKMLPEVEDDGGDR